MSTLKNIVRGTSALAISNVVARAASFVSVIIATALLSLHDYGLLTLALALSGPILSICNLGMDELINADVSRFIGEKKKPRAKRLLISYFKMQWLIAPVLLFGLFLGKSLLVGRYGALIETNFWPLALFVVLQLARTGLITFFNIHTRFVEIAKIQALEPIVRCLVMIGLWYAGGISVTAVLYGYVVGSLVSMLIALPQLRFLVTRYRTEETSPEPILRWILWNHGKWQGLLSILASVINSLRYYFVNHIISTEAVALFGVAQSMYSVVTSLLPLKTVIAPLISRRVHDKALIRAFIGKASKYAFLLYSAATIAVMFVAPPFITIFFPKYMASIFLFEIMVLRLPLNMFTLIHGPLLVAYRDQKLLSGLAILNLVLMLALSPLFLHLFGVVGVIMENLCTVIVIMAVREYYLRSKYKIATWNMRAFFSYDDKDREVIAELQGYARRMFQKLSR